jgi:micrococcal nuclease
MPYARLVPIVVLAAALVAALAFVRHRPESLPAGGTVVRAIDGDTILVQAGGKIWDVRLLGIDTPETVDPRKPVQCFGPEASHFTKHLVTGRRVVLRYDKEHHDRYGRLLAYVYLLSGRNSFLNALLVRLGYARTVPFAPNTEHAGELAALERKAALAGRGLWSAC